MGWNPSHIPGKYYYSFNGLEYVRVPQNATLDTADSFSIGWMQRQTRLDCGIWSKGDPSAAANFSWYIESINGFLRIVLSDGTDTIAWDTDNPVANSTLKLTYHFVWNHTDNTLDFFVDGNPSPVTVNGTVGSITDPASLGPLNTVSADIEFGRVLGRPLFQGDFYPSIMEGIAVETLSVDAFYQAIKDTGQTPPARDVLIATTQFGTRNMIEMTENGQDRQALELSVYHDYYPRYNRSYNSIYFISNESGNNTTLNYLGMGTWYKKPLDPDRVLTSAPESDSLERRSRSIGSDGTGRQAGAMYPRSYETSSSASGGIVYAAHERTLAYTDSFAIASWDTDAQGAITSLRNGDVISGGSRRYPDGDPQDENKFIHISGKTAILYCQENGAAAGNILSTLHSSPRWISNLRYSPDGSLIGFSERDTSGYYQIWTMTRGGASATQVTSGDYDHMFSGFKPDNTKILYSAFKNGVNWQMFTADIDGSNEKNISNNSFHDTEGDWKA
jgi:hypothetical protein